MNDIEHPMITEIERIGYPDPSYLEYERENTHPSNQEE